MTRRGLVLGGGGLLGAAWMVGTMCALEDELGVDLTTVDFIAGTSAGSVVGALLAAGVTPREMAAHQRGDSLADGPLAGLSYDYGVMAERPSRPEHGVGSPFLLKNLLRRPRAYPSVTWVAALLPRGRGPMGELPALVDAVLPAWPSRPELALCAMDFVHGTRRVFGQADLSVRPSVAINASCAIPGWFAPVVVDGHTYVDGGSYSFTSIDVAAGRELDEVYVLAPLAHMVRASGPRTVGGQLLRWWRLPQTRRMHDEAEQLRREGTEVRILAPDADDLAALGLNPMADDRRVAVLEGAMRRRVRIADVDS